MGFVFKMEKIIITFSLQEAIHILALVQDNKNKGEEPWRIIMKDIEKKLTKKLL
jgi:hypothetical protein